MITVEKEPDQIKNFLQTSERDDQDVNTSNEGILWAQNKPNPDLRLDQSFQGTPQKDSSP